VIRVLKRANYSRVGGGFLVENCGEREPKTHPLENEDGAPSAFLGLRENGEVAASFVSEASGKFEVLANLLLGQYYSCIESCLMEENL